MHSWERNTSAHAYQSSPTLRRGRAESAPCGSGVSELIQQLGQHLHRQAFLRRMCKPRREERRAACAGRGSGVCTSAADNDRSCRCSSERGHEPSAVINRAHKWWAMLAQQSERHSGVSSRRCESTHGTHVHNLRATWARHKRSVSGPAGTGTAVGRSAAAPRWFASVLAPSVVVPSPSS